MERFDRGMSFPDRLQKRRPSFPKVAENVLVENGLYDTMMFTPDGPGGIFALYVLPGTNLHRVLLNEFMTVSISHSFPSSQFDSVMQRIL